MVTFPVDDVTPVTDALPTRPLAEQFPDALVVGGDQAVLEPDGVHPLLSAVAKAFAEHRPLVLTPDAVWLTIARGIAQHVKLHAEELRPLLALDLRGCVPGMPRVQSRLRSVGPKPRFDLEECALVAVTSAVGGSWGDL